MKIFWVMAVVLAGLCAGCQTSRALKGTIPASGPVGLHDQRRERIGEAVRQSMRKEGIPGISIAVIDHEEVVWAQGFGWRDVARRLPVDTDTQFQAGSISKPVTALGVLQLEAAGKVSLDEDVNVYLEGWRLDSRFTNTITLRQLLCHRAGMVPHGFLGSPEHAKALSSPQVLQRRKPVLSWLTRHYLGTIKVAKPPGSVYSYSGGGYCVAQKAVEDVTGQSFEAAIDQLVLQPAGMSRSTFQQPPQETNNIARGYGTSIGRGFVIMTNANKHRLTPVMKAIAREFAWTPNR